MIVFNVFIFVSPLFSSKCFSRWITSHTECNHSAKPGTDRTALRKSLIIQPIANRRRNARRLHPPPIANRRRNARRLHPAAGLNLQVNPVTKRRTIGGLRILFELVRLDRSHEDRGHLTDEELESFVAKFPIEAAASAAFR